MKRHIHQNMKRPTEHGPMPSFKYCPHEHKDRKKNNQTMRVLIEMPRNIKHFWIFSRPKCNPRKSRIHHRNSKRNKVRNSSPQKRIPPTLPTRFFNSFLFFNCFLNSNICYSMKYKIHINKCITDIFKPSSFS